MFELPRNLSITQPRTLAFGVGTLAQCGTELIARGSKRVFLLTSRSTARLAEPIRQALSVAGIGVEIYSAVPPEPTIAHFQLARSAAEAFGPEAVVGLGGGSALDVAKLVAALLGGGQSVEQAFGIGNLQPRRVFLACLPTTAGTGSEVSPNAVLLDTSANLKKAAISPHLVPDAAYLDPELTVSAPPAITAATGVDALSHCIEAHANVFAHPLVDPLALEGIRLIRTHLPAACARGDDLPARSAVLLGSLFGGLCLGPVNTGAVHALSYPLGGEFRIAHGVANAVLLPHVLRFNQPGAPERYARIAEAMGCTSPSALVEAVADLSRKCGIPASLRELGIPKDAIPRLATAAMTVKRLLDRNVRPVALADAVEIYERAF